MRAFGMATRLRQIGAARMRSDRVIKVSTASWAGGTVTLTTVAAHNLATGQVVNIAGVTPSGYNGAFSIVFVSATTFTYAAANPGAFSSGGVIT
jgi:hypothetical protein